MAWERVMNKKVVFCFLWLAASVLCIFLEFFPSPLYSVLKQIYRRNSGACCTGADQLENPPIKWRIHFIFLLSSFPFHCFLVVPVFFSFWSLCPFICTIWSLDSFCWAWPILFFFLFLFVFFCWTKAHFFFSIFFFVIF